ncbi:MAG: polysaccharide pyruvyl transferase family protein [Chthoniobacteraceae bacterium]
MLRVGLITTLDTNLGDDCIREGICHVLREVCAGGIDFVPINKHQPLTVYPSWHPARWPKFAKRLPRGGYRLDRMIAALGSAVRTSRFDGCDLIVQCGAPTIWPKCHECEWAGVLWTDVVGRLSGKGVRVLNLGAGACFPWEAQPRSIEIPEDAAFLRETAGYCSLTTVRDVLAEQLLKTLGVDATFLPCPAFLAGRGYGSDASSPENLVLINYMDGGGHFDWGQGIAADDWRHTVNEVIANLRATHHVAFLCHDEKERLLAEQLWPDLPRHLPKTPQEFCSLVSRAKFALCNRLHATVAMAGCGVPSVAVGTDTRMLMVGSLGLPCHYVKQATAAVLLRDLQRLAGNREQERERLRALREATWTRYCELVGAHVRGARAA